MILSAFLDVDDISSSTMLISDPHKHGSGLLRWRVVARKLLFGRVKVNFTK